MKVSVLIDNHLPVNLEDYNLKGLDVARLREVIGEIRPQRLTAFAYGHDGWAQYPSKLNRAPLGMTIDLLQFWKSLAVEVEASFAIYVSTLRNDLLLRKHPDWERVGLNGIPVHRIDHASPYLQDWLLPALRELQARYEPDGYFFDGDYWTVGESISSWRAAAARKLFPEKYGDVLPQLTPAEHRYLTVQTYNEYLCNLGKFLAPVAPRSSINLAYTLRHPAIRPSGINLVTSDLPPFFAAIDCWIETAVQHGGGGEREVVVPLFVEPEGGGRKYTKSLMQLVQEIGPILAMDESLHVYFPLDVSGTLRADYSQLLVDLRKEIGDIAPSLNVSGYEFEPDVYCLSDSDELLYSQNFSWLRGAALASSLAGLNMCIGPTAICEEKLEGMRLLLAPPTPSPSAQNLIVEAKRRGVSVLQRDFASANFRLTSNDLLQLTKHYAAGPKTWWSAFSVERPAGAFIRAFRSADGRWRLFVFNAVEKGIALGRHVISPGAGEVGRVAVKYPVYVKPLSIEGYVSSIERGESSVSFNLDGAFAVIEGTFI